MTASEPLAAERTRDRRCGCRAVLTSSSNPRRIERAPLQPNRRERVHRESSDSSDSPVAVALLRQQGARLISPVEHRADNVGISDLVALLEADYSNQGRHSLPSARYRLRHLVAAFGSWRAVDITYKGVEAYMSKRRREGAAPSTIRYELVLLGRMFSLAVKAGLLISRPLLPTIKVQNTRQGFFEDDELARVLEHLPEYARQPIHFAAITGCRIGEIRLLQWCHVDFKEGVIHLAPATAKKEAERTWPFGMHAGLMTVILGQRESAQAWEQKHGRPLPWVFHRDGRPLGNFCRSWETACRKAGCPGRVVHDLRRTAVRNLVRAGVMKGVAMQLTGHKTRLVFDRYDITSDVDLGTAIKKLAASSPLCTSRHRVEQR